MSFAASMIDARGAAVIGLLALCFILAAAWPLFSR